MSLRSAAEQDRYEADLDTRAAAFDRFRARAASIPGDPVRVAFNEGWRAREGGWRS